MRCERIETDPDVMDGKPVIRGTRVPVELVLRKLGAGMSAEAIVIDHPRLTHDDIRAAQAFAADYLAGDAYEIQSAPFRQHTLKGCILPLLFAKCWN
jgi:uncharacterized protein (DUF433 family)